MPIYEYECSTCGAKFEKHKSVSDRRKVVCEKCANPVDIVIGRVGVIAFSYYNDALKAELTGPRQKQRLLNERGLVDISDTPPSNLPKAESKLERELASPEFTRKFMQTYQDVVG